MAWCVSLMLYLARLNNSPQTVKQQVLTHFKNEYHLRAKRAQCVGEVPLSLPMPHVFMAECPDLFHKVFLGEKPIPSLIDLASVDLPVVLPRPSKKDSMALSILQQPGSATPAHLRIVEQMLHLQQENMKLLQSSVGSRNLLPCSLTALAAPPMAALQDQVHHRWALPSSSSASQETLGGVGEPRQDGLGEPRQDDLGEPRQDDLGEPRQDAPHADSDAEVHTVREESQHPDSGEPTIAMPEDVKVGEPTSPKSELSSAPTLAALPLPIHDIQSHEALTLVDTSCQHSLSPSDNQMVAVCSPSNPASLAIEVAPTSLAQRILDDMGHMERAKAQAQAKAKKEAKASNAKPKEKGKAKATAKAKGKAGKAKANAKAQAIGEAILTEGPAKKRLQIDNEHSRKTIRARIPNGPSKGFKYTCKADMKRARKEAEEYIRANS